MNRDRNTGSYSIKNRKTIARTVYGPPDQFKTEERKIINKTATAQRKLKAINFITCEADSHKSCAPQANPTDEKQLLP
jgi:hypothetical protein